MRSRLIIATVLAVIPTVSSFAQQSHLDTRQQIEQMAATFSQYYNKQDAAAIATMFTKDAVQISPGMSAANAGPQAIEEAFKTQ
jgi:ketosteroid isomerase-like protein